MSDTKLHLSLTSKTLTQSGHHYTILQSLKVTVQPTKPGQVQHDMSHQYNNTGTNTGLKLETSGITMGGKQRHCLRALAQRGAPVSRARFLKLYHRSQFLINSWTL